MIFHIKKTGSNDFLSCAELPLSVSVENTVVTLLFRDNFGGFLNNLSCLISEKYLSVEATAFLYHHLLISLFS